ncbi:MAG: acetyl-CoA C-acetyltransferase [Proteobacteria bacterium]|nr:acetyl-CoA C-acetyltransferase [Pseudomonadota bacterium]
MKHQNKFTQERVYIVDGARTPFLKMKEGPGPFSASDLAVNAGRALLARQSFAPEKFDQVVMGCAAPSENEANIARVIALRLGCGPFVPAFTVQRNCASGLQAIDSAAEFIRQNKAHIVLAGGCEAMSRAPLLLSNQMTRWLASMKQARDFPTKLKSIIKFKPQYLVPIIALLKGLTDPIVNMNMGQTAEELAYLFDISREQMDQFALLSHQKATKAQANGVNETIIPLYGQDGSVLEQDDGVRPSSSLEKLSKLKPVFEKFGSITAGNSSQISDGAALLILASQAAVEKYQLPILARIVDIQWAALDPAIMGLGPIYAMTPILKNHGLTLNDIDHIEINEAFAAQVIACVKAWDDDEYCRKFLGLKEKMGEINSEKLNPQGGAIALGHPVGASGTRLVLHCAHMLEKNKQKRALASLCIGGGQGGAILIERVTNNND